MKKTKPLKNLILEHDLEEEEFWDEFFDNLREEVLDYEEGDSDSDCTNGSV